MSQPGEPSAPGRNRPLAVIDIGSNSVRLAVVETDGAGDLNVIEEGRAVPRLVREVRHSGRLSDQAIDTVIDILWDFRALADATNAREILVVATSAVRDAENSSTLVTRVAAELGLVVEIVSGTREADLAFRGAVHGLPAQHGIVVDIGGASLEVVHFAGRRVVGAWTTPLGAVRLADEFSLTDLPSRKALAALRAHVAAVWHDQGIPPLEDGGVLIGTGGTVRNLAKMDRVRRQYPLPRLHGYALSIDRLPSILDVLIRRDQRGRASLTGLNPDRADTIVSGAVTALTVLGLAGAEELIVSGQGLREGLALSAKGADRSLPDVEAVRRAAVARVSRRFGVPEGAARMRRQIMETLQRVLGASICDEVHTALYVANELLDIGRAIDYYTRDRQTEAILLAHGLAGFSHRDLALVCAIIRSAGNERYGALSYQPLLSQTDLADIGAAGTLLAACDEVAQRLPADLPVSAEPAASDPGGPVILTAGGRNAQPSMPVLDGRFAKAFGRSLILRRDS